MAATVLWAVSMSLFMLPYECPHIDMYVLGRVRLKDTASARFYLGARGLCIGDCCERDLVWLDHWMLRTGTGLEYVGFTIN